MQCMRNCQPQNRKRRNKQLSAWRTDKIPSGTKGLTSIHSYREYVRPAELHSLSAGENCPTSNVASLRSVEVSPPLAPLKRLSLVDLPSANGFDKLSAASKLESKQIESFVRIFKTVSLHGYVY